VKHNGLDNNETLKIGGKMWEQNRTNLRT